MTKQKKTPAQRAQEALALEERRVKRLTDKRTTLKAELDAVDRERDQAVARRDYLKNHPDLQQQPTTGPTTTTDEDPQE